MTHNKLTGDPMSGVVLHWGQKVYNNFVVDMSYNFLEGQPDDVGSYDANCFWGNTYTREPSGCSSCTTPSCCASALNTCTLLHCTGPHCTALLARFCVFAVGHLSA